MSSPEIEQHRTQPPPQSQTGHPLPRRTTAAHSVTLRHHRLARDASLRAGSGSAAAMNSNEASSLSRRNSSGESYETGQSDPKKWFDKSNENPTATFDNNAMEVDPPFFQKESDSSNEDKPSMFQRLAVPPMVNDAQSSSADDYRSVIDDLTVEIQKLKEELKRYKQKGPDMLRKDKLFEIKMHGLPKRKKRELESTLRDFAATLQDSPDVSCLRRKNSSRHANRDHMYSASGSASKHASSSSGSNIRPVDSAYASMSTGAHSLGTSSGRPHDMSPRVKSSEQKVESYLRDIPEGLYPRHMAMTDKDRKNIVVRRLEQLFTGKIGGRHERRSHPLAPPPGTGVLAPIIPKGQPEGHQKVHQPPALATAAEATREARICSVGQGSGDPGQINSSMDNASACYPNGNQIELGVNDNGSRSATEKSLLNMPLPPDQRPTRPNDLDPDRIQVPSENMEYIRHLGLVPPELAVESTKAAPDVLPDADGWVYLNLLCSMAQLHIINVTPSFVRSAVSEISTKFQLSPDGRKIRWRGGIEGTKFATDSSGGNSQRSPETDDTTSSDKGSRRKRQKMNKSNGESQPGISGENVLKFGPQIPGSAATFHYKPLFVQQESPNGQTSPDDVSTSFGPVEDSNLGESRWGLSGSGSSVRKKRRNNGAIIYYSGAPFCTDLSGDTGDASPTAHMRQSGQDEREQPAVFARPLPRRTESGLSLSHRPLMAGHNMSLAKKMDINENPPELTVGSDDQSSDLDFDLPWASGQQYMEACPLEPCGLGGVLPDDHFMVVVTTKRPKEELRPHRPWAIQANTDGAADGIVDSLAAMSTASRARRTWTSSSRNGSPGIEIEYVSGRIKRLVSVPLPPPAIFFHLNTISTDSSSEWDDDLGSEGDIDDGGSSGNAMIRQFKPYLSNGYPDGVDLTSGDEDGEDPECEPDTRHMYNMENSNEGGSIHNKPSRQSIDSAEAAPGSVRGRSKSASEAMASAD